MHKKAGIIGLLSIFIILSVILFSASSFFYHSLRLKLSTKDYNSSDEINSDFSKNITNFNECTDAGYPVLESLPRQCLTENRTFIENLSLPDA